MIDLHVHSTKSDGTYSPAELVDYAIKKKLTAFALTDHDTVAGLSDAIKYAQKLKEKGINVPEVIPGIELSTEYEGKDVHVVGLYIDYESEAFIEYLEQFIASRDARNEKVCQKLREHGIKISMDELTYLFPDSVITRAHFAKFLMQNGYCSSLKEAFDRYIGDNASCYVPREKITPQMAVELILRGKGIPVFAHPMLCKFGRDKLEKLISSMKEVGLMGIEGLYSTYSMSDQVQVTAYAKRYHLLLSGGSDFHGSNKQGIDLATGYGNLCIDDAILNQIKKSRKNILFTDMDGTLLLSDSTISVSMQNALKSMVERGYSLVLSSGRPLPSIQERIIKLGLNNCVSYISAFNGGLVYDCKSQQVIRRIRLSSDIVRRVIKLCNDASIHAHCYSDTEIVGTCEDEEILYYRSRVHMPFVLVDDISNYLTEGSYKVQIIDLNGRRRLEKLRDKIASELGDVTDSVFSNDYYLEILPKGVNKGDAVRFIADYMPVPMSNTFASGDENNDISMIKAAGCGIAMANATSEVKSCADIITVNDNNHDGLIEIIDKYFN